MPVSEIHVHEAGAEVEDPPLSGVQPGSLGPGNEQLLDARLRGPGDEDVIGRIAGDVRRGSAGSRCDLHRRSVVCHRMRLGINLWPQNTTWEQLRKHALLADERRFDSLWVWDHFYSINGDLHRPNLEGWQLQAAYAALTEHVRIGCPASGVTHRHPAVLANMATTLDNISNGRAILGIGAAWNQAEHTAYGLDLGTPGERSTRFAEAAKIIRSLVDGERVTYSGRYYDLTNAEVLVRPVQERLPI